MYVYLPFPVKAEIAVARRTCIDHDPHIEDGCIYKSMHPSMKFVGRIARNVMYKYTGYDIGGDVCYCSTFLCTPCAEGLISFAGMW